LHSSSLFASTQQIHKSRSQPPLPFDMSKFARENCFLALGVCFPQPLLERRPHVCCVKITITIRMNCYTITNSMKCLVNWIPLRIFVRSRNTQPHLKVGLGILKWRDFSLQGASLDSRRFTRRFIGVDFSLQGATLDLLLFKQNDSLVVLQTILTRRTCGQRLSMSAGRYEFAICFVSTTTNLIKCHVNGIPLRTNVRSRNT